MTGHPTSPPASADVVVVGGGLAGHCAALEAAACGARVVLLERESRIGGATVLSGGSFAFAGTPLQAQENIEDNAELLFDDLRRVGGYKNDASLVRTYVDQQLAAYRWLSELGVTFDKVFIASGQSAPRAHSRNPTEVLAAVAHAAHERGVVTCLSTHARRLRRDGEYGRVTGIDITSPPGAAQIRADRGVVLATGGFSRNERLLRLFAPAQAAAQRMGGAGNQGDGLLMAWQLGAAFRDMGYIKGTFGSHPSAGNEDHYILFPIYAGAIAVNLDAQRFTDESCSYKLIGDACLQQREHRAFQIFDQRIFGAARPGIPAMDFTSYLAAGRVVKADSLSALATAIGVDAAALQATVEAYNRAVGAGERDAFGRTSLCNGFGTLLKIEEPPYYAYASTSVVLATYCGLAVDRDMRVLDVFDEAIAGLYAAGGVIGGFHGVAYMTGTANGKATIFGRIAGRSAAQETFSN